MSLSIVVAFAKNLAIGKDNKLLWRQKADMQYFKKLTQGKTVLMGKNTYLSLPKAFRPLPNRLNIVISSGEPVEIAENLVWYTSLDNALTDLAKNEEEIMIIGGAQIYKQAITKTDTIFATEIDAVLDADTFFPEINLEIFDKISSETFSKDADNEYNYAFVVYKRK
jgi:dihydrofolate reductase